MFFLTELCGYVISSEQLTFGGEGEGIPGASGRVCSLGLSSVMKKLLPVQLSRAVIR